MLTSSSSHLRRVREESRRQQQSAARASSVTVARTASTREASSPTSTLTSTGPDSGDTVELFIGDGQSNIIIIGCDWSSCNVINVNRISGVLKQ